MVTDNNIQTYSHLRVGLHWLMALLIIELWFHGQWMIGLPYGVFRNSIYNWHKQLGLLVGLLAVIRSLVTCFSRPVRSLSMPLWQYRLSRLVHLLLYMLMWWMPLTGYFMALASNKAPMLLGLISTQFSLPLIQGWREALWFAHDRGSKVLLVLVFMHTVGFFQHLYMNGRVYWKRMWFSF